MSKKRFGIYIFAALPLIMVSMVYQKLPPLVPIQWQAGEGIRYSEKWQLFIVAVLCLGMGILMPLMAKIDPRRKNYEKFFGVYENIILAVEIFMTAMVAILLSESMNPSKIPVPRIVSCGVGLFFVFLGNVMPKVKSNFFTGIKTPWALCSESVWNKTQRLGGKLFFFGGVFMAVSAIFMPLTVMPYAIGTVLFVVILLPTILSCFWYQEEGKTREK